MRGTVGSGSEATRPGRSSPGRAGYPGHLTLIRPPERIFTSSERLAALTPTDVSIWLDDLSRDHLICGDLQQLITAQTYRRVTTKRPSSRPLLRTARPTPRKSESAPAPRIGRRRAPQAHDRRRSAGLRAVPAWDSTGGVEGRVSLEVNPNDAMPYRRQDVQSFRSDFKYSAARCRTPYAFSSRQS